MNQNADPNRLNANTSISQGAEQDHLSPTDKDDLDAAVHNANIPVEGDTLDETVMYGDNTPQGGKESDSRGGKNQQV